MVDDDPSIRLGLVHAFELAHYDVIAFASAVDFLSVEQPRWPAVLILDVRMGDMTGVELQTSLATKGLDLPIIFISGSSTVYESVKAMKGGAVDFLLKPFQMKDLLTVTETAFVDLLAGVAPYRQQPSRLQ